MAIDYATKWLEARTLHTNNAIITMKFLYEHIFTKFGCCEEFLHTFHMKICTHKTHLGVELLCNCIITS